MLRPIQMARILREEGHDVVVLTHTYEKNEELRGGSETLRVYDPSHNKNRNGVRRFQWLALRLLVEALNRLGVDVSIYSWWKRRVLKRGRKIVDMVKPDVIVATYPPAEILEIGLGLSRMTNAPLVSDFRDGLMFEPIERVRINKYPCVKRSYQRLEEQVTAHSAAIVTIADPITEYFNRQYQFQKAVTLSSGFDPHDFNNTPEPVALDASRFNILFTGRFGLSCNYNQVEFFFDAVRSLAKGEPELGGKLCVHLLGEYSKDELKQLSDLLDAGLVKHHGFVPREVSLASQLAADLLLIISPPDRKSATSTKIFEYLFSGRPILALTHQTVIEQMVQETRSGWVVHPHHTDEIEALLLLVLTDRQFYNTIKPSREAVNKYSTRRQMKALEQLLKGIIASDLTYRQ